MTGSNVSPHLLPTGSLLTQWTLFQPLLEPQGLGESKNSSRISIGISIASHPSRTHDQCAPR